MPERIPPSIKGLKIRKMNAFIAGKLMFYMLEGKYTLFELSELCGMHYVTVQEYAREWHNAKAIHIVEWQHDAKGRDSIRVYKVGVGKDAPRFRFTQAERAARSRTSKKARALQAALTFTTPIPQTVADATSKVEERSKNETHDLPNYPAQERPHALTPLPHLDPHENLA